MSRTSYLARLFGQLFGADDDVSDEDSMVLEQGTFEAILVQEREEANAGNFGFTVIAMSVPSQDESSPDVKSTILFMMQNIRLIDEMGWLPDHRLGIFLVDTTRRAAERFIARLCSDQQCPLPLQDAEILTYPEDESHLFGDAVIRRRSERLPLDLEATVVSDDFTAEIKTKDVSSRGAYLLTAEPMAANTEVDIEISLPFAEVESIEGENIVLRTKGKVIRSDSNGTAVEFVHECDFMNVRTLGSE